MTNRQHQLIMTLFARCDEINAQLSDLDYTDHKYAKLIGAHEELVALADKLKRQFTAEAEALNKVHSYLPSKVNINA